MMSFLRCFQGHPESRFRLMKFGRDVTLDDGGNYFTFHELNVRIKIKNKYVTTQALSQLLNKCCQSASLQF